MHAPRPDTTTAKPRRDDRTTLRPATMDDLPELERLEAASFSGDRLSRRSLRHLLRRGHARTLVAERASGLAGYAMILLRRGTSLARLYSIAVDASARGSGLGRRLAEAVEREALALDCAIMRLEIRPDNAASLALFRSLGYRAFGRVEGYYEDDSDALRFEKHLAPHLEPGMARVPFYRQTLEFTCGPAALMMAMSALDASTPLDRRTELRLWRESTTIFMASGHGGCGPEGLALAARHRGFQVAVHLNAPGPLLLDSVRSAEKKAVIELVHEDFVSELRNLGVAIHHRALRFDELAAAFADGAIPLVLISLYRILRERTPHWVTVTGLDERYVYVNDPWVDEASGRNAVDCINLPILRQDFDRMARYGRSGQRAVVLVRPRPTETTRG